VAGLIRVGLVDGDADIRAGRRMIFEAQEDMQIVFEDDDAISLLSRAPQALIDVLVVDHRLKNMDGVAAVTALTMAYADAEAERPVVILTGPYFSRELQLASIAAGATDLVTQEDGPIELLKAVRSSRAKGQNPNFAELGQFLASFDELPAAPIGFALNIANLDQQTELVFSDFMAGQDDMQIAERLGIPAYRVRKTLADLVNKCGFATRAQLFLAMVSRQRSFESN
jgi:two-component system NarL family response regulator